MVTNILSSATPHLCQPATNRANPRQFLAGPVVYFNRRGIAVNFHISPQFRASWCSFDDQILLAQVPESNYVAEGYGWVGRNHLSCFLNRRSPVRIGPGAPFLKWTSCRRQTSKRGRSSWLSHCRLEIRPSISSCPLRTAKPTDLRISLMPRCW